MLRNYKHEEKARKLKAQTLIRTSYKEKEEFKNACTLAGVNQQKLLRTFILKFIEEYNINE